MNKLIKLPNYESVWNMKVQVKFKSQFAILTWCIEIHQLFFSGDFLAYVDPFFKTWSIIACYRKRSFELFINSVKSYSALGEGFSGQPVCLTCRSEVSICNTVDTMILSHQKIKANQNTIGRWPNERYPRKQCFKCSH